MRNVRKASIVRRASIAVAALVGLCCLVSGPPDRRPASTPTNENKNGTNAKVSNPANNPKGAHFLPHSGSLAVAQPDDIANSVPSIKPLVRQLEALDLCYRSECGYPRTDEKSYDFAVGQDLKKKLFQLTAQVEQEKITAPFVSELARRHLKNPDGHVKEAALNLIASQPISDQNLDSLLADVLMDYDAQLIQHALLELTRYQEPTQVQRIHRALAQALVFGAPFVSAAVAENISLFINESSYRFFDTVKQRLRPSSLPHRYLQSSLHDFRLRQSGG